MRRTISKRLISWASLLDDKALAQSERAASMPFVFPHLALMPDAHLGKGATVGSVIPTLRAIIPAAVGVDIGCGMIAVRTHNTVMTHTARERVRIPWCWQQDRAATHRDRRNALRALVD